MAIAVGAACESFQLLRHRLRRHHRQRDVHRAQLALHRRDQSGRITRRSRDDRRRQRRRTGCTSYRTAARSGSRTSSAKHSPCRYRARRRSPRSTSLDRSRNRNRRPTAFTAPKYCRAIVSVITATRGVSARSRASNTRPYTSGMRSVSKKPGPAADHRPLPVASVDWPRRQRRSARRCAPSAGRATARRIATPGIAADAAQKLVVHARRRVLAE